MRIGRRRVVHSNARVARETIVLKSGGEIVYAGPISVAPIDKEWDEVVLNPHNAPTFLGYAGQDVTGAEARA